MNKAELIEALSTRFDGNKAEAGRALNAVIETIIEHTAKGEKVSITGFGIFEKVHRAARMVRNPRTGERKKAKATYVPRFRAGSELKAYVSGEKKFAKTTRKSATPKSASTRTTTSTSTAKTVKPVTKAATRTTVRTTAVKKPTTKTVSKAPARKTTGRKTK